MIKKTITLVLTFAIVISCFVPSAFADDTTSVGEVVDDIVSGTIASALLSEAFTAVGTGAGIYFGYPAVGTFVGGIVGEGIQNLADYYAAGYTDQDIYDQFTNYNAQLETDLGTATLINGGVRVYCVVRGSQVLDATMNSFTGVDDVSFTANFTPATTGASGVGIMVYYPTVPFNSYCSGGLVSSLTGCYLSDNRTFTDNSYIAAGQSAPPTNGSPAVWFFGNTPGSVSIASGSLYVDMIPASGTLPTGLDITSISRPTTLTTPIAVRNDDDTYTVYNQNIVNETDSTIFNPVTNTTAVFTDWAFDYSTRTYTLTLEDGSTVTVQYGDSIITIIEGDVIYNAYYTIPAEDDPGTNPDHPGTDDSSGWAWWKDAWNGFVDRLFTVLNGGDLEVILPGEEGNPDNEEDDGWTVFDLFALIRDALWKIITGVISVVLNGFLGLVDAIASLGDFFDVYDTSNPDGIFGVPGGGADLWS